MKQHYISRFALFVLVTFVSMQANAQDDQPIPDKSVNLSDEILSTHAEYGLSIRPLSIYIDRYACLSHPSGIYADLYERSLLEERSALKYLPHLGEYNRSDYKILQNLSLTPYNHQYTYVGLGNFNNIGALLRWTLSDNFSAEGGTFMSIQYGFLKPSRHIAYGYKWKLNYDITSKIRLSVGGQSMRNGNDGPLPNYNNELPKTNREILLQYKPKANSKVGIGMEYQYDEKNNTWKSEGKGTVSFGF